MKVVDDCRKVPRRLHAGCFLITAAGLLGTGAAIAQEAVAASESVQTPEPEVLPTIPVKDSAPSKKASRERVISPVIEEIIVTATKREESVREIPTSISVVSGDDLEKQGAQGAEDIVKLVPGVNITAAGDSAARITVRGISAQAGTNSTTGLLFGDVSFSDAYLPRVTLDPNPFDLQSVEVLKGPQGTLFGAGALNGAIRYVPQAPNFSEFQVKYFGQYTRLSEGDGRPIYGAAVNVPIGDREAAAVRVVGFSRRAPGYIDDTQSGIKDVNKLKQYGIRGILGWHPGEALKLSLTYARQETDVADTSVADNIQGRLSHGNRPRASPSHSEYDLFDLGLHYALGWGDIASESSYIRKQATNFFDASSRVNGQIATLAQADTSSSDTFAQELRLVSNDEPDDRWKYVVGAFTSKQHVDYALALPLGNLNLPTDQFFDLLNQRSLSNLLAGGNPILASITTDVNVQELALFSDITRRFGTDWELSLGGRLYRTTSGGTAEQGGILLTVVNGELDHIIRGTVKATGFSPKASLLWHATDNALLYSAVSRGFRVGGVQAGYSTAGAQNAAPDVFKSDTIWNYEAGLRTEWLDRTLHFDVTGYYERWKNPQVLQVDGNTVSSYFDNAGGVKSEGIDVALQYLFPIRGLSILASGAYNNTVTTKPFTNSDGSIAEPGSAWPFAPHYQTSSTLAYQHDFDPLLMGASVTHTYLSKASNDLAQKLQVFGYQQVDLQFTLANPSIPWLPDLAFNVDNLLDERGIVFEYVGNTYTDATYIRPRAYTLRLSGHF